MAVSITGISGSSAHGNSLTITGSGFGTKSPVAPLVWDDCSASDVLNVWDGAWPTANATYNTNYRTVSGLGRGVARVHSRNNSRYLCGSHYGSGGPEAGYNVMAWKTVTPIFPAKYFISWWCRFDPLFDPSGGIEENHKHQDLSGGTSAYDTNNWYISWNPGLTSFPITGWYTLRDFAGKSFWGDGTASNPITGWRKYEWELTIDTANGTTRYYDLASSTTAHLSFTGQDTSCTASGTPHHISCGGFGRPYGRPDNWRYFMDLYVDATWQRVILGNASTLAACTTREVQIPTAWTDASVTIKVNRGLFSDSATIYLYVYDATGQANANGFLVASGDTKPPSPPKNLRIQ